MATQSLAVMASPLSSILRKFRREREGFGLRFAKRKKSVLRLFWLWFIWVKTVRMVFIRIEGKATCMRAFLFYSTLLYSNLSVSGL